MGHRVTANLVLTNPSVILTVNLLPKSFISTLGDSKPFSFSTPPNMNGVHEQKKKVGESFKECVKSSKNPRYLIIWACPTGRWLYGPGEGGSGGGGSTLLP